MVSTEGVTVSTLFEQLVGTWELVSYTVTDQHGSVSHPLGEDAAGFITYTGDGYVSAQLMRSGRPAYVSGDVHQGSAGEMSVAASGYLAYAGPFYVDEEAHTLRHHMTVSLFPNWLGNSQARHCDVSAEKLVLSAERQLLSGAISEPRIEWRRAPSNHGFVL